MSRIAVPLLLVSLVVVGIIFYQFQQDTDLGDLDRTNITIQEEGGDAVRRTGAPLPVSSNRDPNSEKPTKSGAQELDDTEAGGAVIGRVVSADGLPVAGVAARLTHSPKGGLFASVKGIAQVLKTAVTDDQGFFTIMGVKEGGPYRVEVWPAELRKATSSFFRIEEGEKHDVGELVATPGAIVEGIVLNEAKVPVPGVQVTISVSDPTEAGFVMLLGPVVYGGRTVVTDENGRFRLAGLDGGQGHVYARAEGYIPLEDLEVAVKNEKPVEGLVVQLARGRRIEGHVQDDTGVSIANATIKYRPQGTFRLLWEQNPNAQVQSDKDGNFVFTGVPLKDVLLTVEADGFMTMNEYRAKASQAHVGIVLEKAALVFAYLVAQGDKRAINDFEVSVEVGDLTLSQDVAKGFPIKKGQEAGAILGKSETAGLFVIHGISRRSLDFSITAPGFGRLDYKISELKPGEERRLEGEMVAEVPFAGMVVDQNGNPVAGATLTMRVKEENKNDVENELMGLLGSDAIPGSSSVLGASSKKTRTKSKSDGTFSFHGLVGGMHLLAVRHPSFLNQVDLPVELGTENPVTDYVVTLLPGASITGVVFDPEGNPFIGAKVSLERKSVAEGGDTEERVMSFSPNWKTSKTSGKGGVYLIEGVKPGDYFVRAEIPAQKATGNVFVILSGGEKQQEGTWVHLEANKLAKQDIHLLKKSRVYGKVRSGGQPVPGAVVRANDVGRPSFFGGGKVGTADDSGAYEIEGLKPGKKKLSLAIPGSPHGESRSVELVEGEDLTVDFEVPSGSISGRVTDENGQGVAQAWIEVKPVKEGDDLEEMENDRINGDTSVVAVNAIDGEGGMIAFGSNSNVDSSGQTDRDGYYRIPYLSAGTYKVTASKDGYSGGDLEQVEVANGSAVKQADLQMEAACRLVVRGSKPGADSAWFNVNVQSVVKGAAGNHKFFVKGGLAKYERLKPGTYTVTCESGGEKKEQSVTLAVGDTKTIRFDF